MGDRIPPPGRRLKLRSKLGITLAVLVIPFAVGVSAWQTSARRSAFLDATGAAVTDQMERFERELCEQSPESWPRVRGARDVRRGRGRGRRPPRLAGRVWAYDASYRSRNPRAPDLQRELSRALASADDVATIERDGPGVLVAVRMPWDEGPCAVVVVRRPTPPEERMGRTLGPVLIVSAAAVLLAVLAAGPIVRRIRVLTERVRGGGADVAGAVGGEDEVAELARAFEESRAKIVAQLDELSQRDEALRTYIANTTHDVMIPLTVLQGHLAAMERALDGGEGMDAPRVRQALEEAHYIASLLHNLNAAARLRTTDVEPVRESVELGGLIERVVARHAPFARQRRVDLNHAVPEGETVVLGDVTLLEQAIGNLVHNAVRYNREGGHVAVVLERDAAQARFAVRVEDDGPGIPKGELARVAERGFRGGEARSRHPHGLGLGLAIARDVAERHGFELRLRPRDEGGLVAEIEGSLRGDEATPT